MRSLIVGHGGREGALGSRMAEHSQLFAFMKHMNPTLVQVAGASGGSVEIGDVCDPGQVAAFAEKHAIDIAMVSADEPLAAGVVDTLQSIGVKTVGPTQSGAEIEWNKEFARSVVDEIAPDLNPRYFVARTPRDVSRAFSAFRHQAVAVKPSGLTGGKGVKVMGPHLKSRDEAERYACHLLQEKRFGECVLIEEKTLGIEFTIQAITDGTHVVLPPATYDYPYRQDGDTGPGTGGMGSFCVGDLPLPFMNQGDYDRAADVVQQVITRLAALGRKFNGVLNSGFFLTNDGLRVIEFNARFGDPECLNIMSLFRGNWINVMRKIIDKQLTTPDVPLESAASVVVYLVTPEYAYGPGTQRRFELDVEGMRDQNCQVIFSAAEHVRGSEYRTVGSSRVAAVAAVASRLDEAHAQLFGCLSQFVTGQELEYRKEIGSSSYVRKLQGLVSSRRPHSVSSETPRSLEQVR